MQLAPPHQDVRQTLELILDSLYRVVAEAPGPNLDDPDTVQAFDSGYALATHHAIRRIETELRPHRARRRSAADR